MCREYTTVTTSSRKNYNALALRGQDIDDMEFVEQFNLDPKLAYTPAINTAMLDRVEQENFEFYVRDGATEAEAKAKARSNRRIAEGQIKDSMKLM